MFFRGRIKEAAQDIEEWKSVEGRDKLIYLTDRGIICHSAGEYKKSIPYLLEAAKLARNFDIIRWEFEAGKFITNEWLEDYRGEDYERALIHTFLALNYIGLGQMDEARVECLNIDRTLRYIAQERGIDYKQNKFSLLLSAMIFEELGEYNDAYIDYKKLYNLDSYNEIAKNGLVRNAHLLKWKDEYEEWSRKFNIRYAPLSKDEAEFIVIFETGLTPVKVESKEFPLIPKYQHRPYSVDQLFVRIDGREVKTKVMDDVADNMVKTLDERITGLAAKRAIALGTKLAVGEVLKEMGKKRQEANKDDVAGQILQTVGVLFQALAIAAERPDTRGIYTFPSNIQIAISRVKVGSHNVRLKYLDVNGREYNSEERSIDVKPGRKNWMIVRSVN